MIINRSLFGYPMMRARNHRGEMFLLGDYGSRIIIYSINVSLNSLFPRDLSLLFVVQQKAGN